MENDIEEILLGKDEPHRFKCLIAVTDEYRKFLIKSDPSLMSDDIFDGFDLEDNITEEKTLPTEVGVYECDILVDYIKSWTDCGYEYDIKSWVENINKII